MCIHKHIPHTPQPTTHKHTHTSVYPLHTHTNMQVCMHTVCICTRCAWMCMHTVHRTCACTERVHTQCAFTQRVHKHRDNKHTTLCDNDTGHACIKSGVHQIHTHTRTISLTPKNFYPKEKIWVFGHHSLSVFHSRRWK